MRLRKEYARTLQVLFAGLGLTLGILYYLLSIPLLSFYSLEPATHELARSFLLVQAVVIMGMSYQMPTMGGIMRGGGNAKYQMKVDLISIWGIVVPLSLCGAFLWNWSPLAVRNPVPTSRPARCGASQDSHSPGRSSAGTVVVSRSANKVEKILSGCFMMGA